jgi:putative ABC transport system substrate-binding protein
VHPGGNITGVTAYGSETWGKRLQILKEAIPSASRAAFLAMRTEWEGEVAQLREAGRQLQISVIGMPLEESTPSAYQRMFAEIAQDRPSAIMVGARAELFPFRQLIVKLVEQNGLPAIYPFREYVVGHAPPEFAKIALIGHQQAIHKLQVQSGRCSRRN